MTILTLPELCQGRPHTHDELWVSWTASLSHSLLLGFSDLHRRTLWMGQGRADGPPPGTVAGKVTPAQMAGILWEESRVM